MTNPRSIKVRENGRLVSRGMHSDRDWVISAKQSKNETLTYTVDWSDWLGGDTISSQAVTADGPTVVAANTTTTSTLTVSGNPGEITVKITTAAALVKEMKLRLYERADTLARERY